MKEEEKGGGGGGGDVRGKRREEVGGIERGRRSGENVRGRGRWRDEERG